MGYIGKIVASGVTHLVGSTLFGTSNTASGTSAKVVSLGNFDTLIAGVTIHVKFSNANTATGITLNVNGTGAKNVYVGDQAPSTAIKWNAGQTLSFTYDGTNWCMNDVNSMFDMDWGEL